METEIFKYAYSITGISSKIWLSKQFKNVYSYIQYFGIFLDDIEAKKAVEENWCDINEGGFYDYIVIEQIVLNSIYFIHPKQKITNQIWFHWSDSNDKYEICDQPDWSIGISRWLS